jgi:hypothetical protein
VKRPKQTKTRNGLGKPAKKTLSDRYAEVVKLRQMILDTASRAKPFRVDRQASE